jgi:hypothetical protein
MSFIIDKSGTGGPVSPSILGATAMDFDMDSAATVKLMNFDTGAILDTYPANVLSAVANGAAGIIIEYVGGEQPIIENLDIDTTKIASVLQTGTQSDTITALNNLFANAGGGVAPTITSAATVHMVVGATLNYETTGTNVVAYSWDTLPTGIVTVEGDHSKIIGGSGLIAGTYSAVARVTNYHGTQTLALSIVVSAAFTNTKSFIGTSNAYMRNIGSATYDTTAFMRHGAGSGISEAWSSSFWVKTAFTGTASQSYGLMFYGKAGVDINGSMTLLHQTSNAGTDNNLYFRYGTRDCYLSATIDVGVASNTWFHVMWTYTGGNTLQTGSGFFEFYINGVLKTPVWSFTGPGLYYTDVDMSIKRNGYFDLCLLLGKELYTFIYAPYTNLEEFATWTGVILGLSDAVALYNSGTPFDINASFTPLPYTYFRCGDGTDVATHPLMSDHATSGIDLTMYNGTVANYVNDTP